MVKARIQGRVLPAAVAPGVGSPVTRREPVITDPPSRSPNQLHQLPEAVHRLELRKLLAEVFALLYEGKNAAKAED